jgi:hypothetical protein
VEIDSISFVDFVSGAAYPNERGKTSPAAWVPAAWMPAAWMPAAWMPAAWMPAAWMPAAWMPAAWMLAECKEGIELFFSF